MSGAARRSDRGAIDVVCGELRFFLRSENQRARSPWPFRAMAAVKRRSDRRDAPARVIPRAPPVSAKSRKKRAAAAKRTNSLLRAAAFRLLIDVEEFSAVFLINSLDTFVRVTPSGLLAGIVVSFFKNARSQERPVRRRSGNKSITSNGKRGCVKERKESSQRRRRRPQLYRRRNYIYSGRNVGSAT